MRKWVVLAAVVIMAGCGGATETPQTADPCDGAVVFAASSFAPVVEGAKAGECLDAATVSLASSTALAAQVADGAPVDVFISAGTDAVNLLLSQGVELGDPVTIGFNRASLMISGSSAAGRGIDSVFDLATADAVIGACIASAPCGRLFDDVMTNASRTAAGRGLELSRSALVDTEAANAADLVSKISMGEIDAGIVYASDCVARRDTAPVRCIEVPLVDDDGSPLNARVPYVVVRVSSTPAAREAFTALTSRAFITDLSNRFGIEPE